MRWLIRGMLVVLVLLGAWHALQWNFYRGALPEGLGIWWRSYAQNRTWGFGPGGNETGFNEFILPDAAAERLAKGGPDYLATLEPIGSRRGWFRDGGFAGWSETPVPVEPPWVLRPGHAVAGTGPDGPSILHLLDRYGGLIAIPPERRARIDTALTAPGSFYAFGAGGRVIVISPPQRRAWVAYAG
ncbi:hypothetical protein [Psychromarinibacter sp. S121]|uniref:hypothetical protein n=1 Tax=Psychromarinibacter sp. S121 TaxID=3415127 RepID=UPI003C7E1284